MLYLPLYRASQYSKRLVPRTRPLFSSYFPRRSWKYYRKQSPPPSYLFPSNNNSHTESIQGKLKTSLGSVHVQHPTEHYIKRYAIFIILNFFLLNTWNLIPQYYTQSRKWLDFVLKTSSAAPDENEIAFLSTESSSSSKP